MTKREVIIETVETEKPIDFRAMANALAEIMMKERLKNDGRAEISRTVKRDRELH